MNEDRAAIAGRLRRQSGACRSMGSPLYGDLLELAATVVEVGGPSARILDGHGRDAPDSALALRFMGGVHRLVLEGRAPELARFYPSTGGKPGAGRDELWAAFTTTLARHDHALRDRVDRRVQTNEVGRCAPLIGGFLLVAEQTRLPLRILEVGAAAGLNLRWDRYGYEARGRTWGDAESLVRLCSFDGDVPVLKTSAEVAERRGCDLSPVDPASEAASPCFRMCGPISSRASAACGWRWKRPRVFPFP